MKQFDLQGNTLTLSVKKSPILVRAFMFFVTFLSFIFSVAPLIFGSLFGFGFQIQYFGILLIFGLIGFYLLRVSLWNTYGKETFNFLTPTILYEADYGWFEDGKKRLELKRFILNYLSVGYEEDNKGLLVLGDGENWIQSVVKMPIGQIDELIEELNSRFKIE